jgi:hypothetical protein
MRPNSNALYGFRHCLKWGCSYKPHQGEVGVTVGLEMVHEPVST